MKTSSDIGELSRSSSYQHHLRQIQALQILNDGTTESKSVTKEDPEYQLLIQSNEILQDIDEDIFQTYIFVANIYRIKFPELETIVPNRKDYIRIVLRLRNEMDISLVDISDILPQSTIMVLSVSASSTIGRKLRDDELEICVRGCEEILKLFDDKSTILRFIESRMLNMAPNLCSLVGPQFTAQLVGAAGGIEALAKIPACNIQVMGQPKRNLMGLSSVSAVSHAGILSNCELVLSSPPAFRKKVLKALASKVALAARVDSFKGGNSGTDGLKFRENIENRLEKLQDIPKARTHRALPIPDEKKKARRGGKRVRKMKERLAMTDLRKQQNKMEMRLDGSEYGDSAMGMETISAGSESGGKLRAAARVNPQLAKKSKPVGQSSSRDASGGMVSSLAFTPVQGIELVNPSAVADRVKEANKKWFDSHSGFLSAKPKAL
jgi:U4/U6 small nuclear ribonucleoprotein PRP31